MPLNDVKHLHNLVIDQTAGCLHADFISFFLANQGTRNWRSKGNFAGFNVGFIFPDYRVCHFVFIVQVEQLNGRSENNLSVGVHFRDIDDVRVGKLAFDIRDTSFIETLLFARSMVFGILFEVAVCARFRNCLVRAGKPGRSAKSTRSPV